MVSGILLASSQLDWLAALSLSPCLVAQLKSRPHTRRLRGKDVRGSTAALQYIASFCLTATPLSPPRLQLPKTHLPTTYLCT